MTVFDLILSFSAPAVLVCVAIIFVRRKLYSEFRWFFVYIVYAPVAMLRVLLSSRPALHFVTYWATEALSGILELLVVREIFHHVFALPYAAYRWFRLLFPGIMLAILALSLWGAFAVPPGWAYIPRAIRGIYWFDLGVHALEGTILLLVLALKIIFPVEWRRSEFGILTGFGIFACITMIADLLVLQQGHTYETFFRYGPPVAYVVATLIWLQAFIGPRQTSFQSQMDWDEMQGVMRRSRELLRWIKRIFELRRQSPAPTV